MALVASVYMYRQYKTAQAILTTHPNANAQEVQSTVAAISAFMELPRDEVPQLATVSDMSKLPPIPIFASAKNGDKILIYQKHAKAIVYRPSTKKIIDVAVFSPLQEQNVTQIPEDSRIKKLTATIRNGTTIPHLSSAFEKELDVKHVLVSVIDTGAASRKNIEDTMIIPMTTRAKAQVAAIAKQLDIAVASLPTGEATTSADILIIVGLDFEKK